MLPAFTFSTVMLIGDSAIVLVATSNPPLPLCPVLDSHLPLG